MPEQNLEIPRNGPVVDTELSQRRLALVAEAAEQLLAADDPARMVDELFALIQSELRLDVFFNYRVEGCRLVLEAHGGLTPEQASAAAELDLGQAVCGCAARDRQRLHVTCVQSSLDPMVAFVRQVGLDAYACTPLLYGDMLIGTLGFGRRWADRFTHEELRFLHTLCHFVSLAKYRLLVERELRTGLEQREKLLGELNHRVRNALQLAVSVLRLEAASARDQEISAALAKAGDLIEVIASAHRPLYISEDLRTVNCTDLLNDTVGRDSAGRRLSVLGPPDASLPIEQGVALALLVHTILAQSQEGDNPGLVEVGRAAPAPWLEVRLTGLQIKPECVSERLPRALLRQLSAASELTSAGLTIRLESLSDD
jgi:two-component sensor histidine kinase